MFFDQQVDDHRNDVVLNSVNECRSAASSALVLSSECPCELLIFALGCEFALGLLLTPQQHHGGRSCSRLRRGKNDGTGERDEGLRYAAELMGGDVKVSADRSQDFDLMAVSSTAAKSLRAVKVAEKKERSGPTKSRAKLDAAIWSELDEHLHEKIIARLPLELLFQVPSLSKSWRMRFRSPSFQSEVQSCSSRATASSSCTSYAPILMDYQKELVGYESSAKRWRRLPTHAFIQQEGSCIEDWCLRATEGPLLCWTCHGDAFGYRSRDFVEVMVTNPFTKSWRQLPTRPDMRKPKFVHVVLKGNTAYKVILGSLISRGSRLWMSMQIFDSTDGTWIVESYKSVGTTYQAEPGGSTVLNGVLHIAVYSTETHPDHRMVSYVKYGLISFDLKEKVWKEIPHIYQVASGDKNCYQLMKFWGVIFSEIVVCGSTVVLVINHRERSWTMDFYMDDSRGNKENRSEGFCVFRLDVKRGLAVKVTRTPNEIFSVSAVCGSAGHGDCIYLSNRRLLGSPRAYNVRTRQWHRINAGRIPSFSDIPMMFTPFTYQPGLNPFLEV